MFLDGTCVIHGEKAVIHMKDNVCPKCCRARTVPYTLRKNVENELDILEKENVIQKVEHSDWATPIVVVPSSSCHQTRVFHLSTHFFAVSLNLVRPSNEHDCAIRVHCIICEMFSVVRPHSQVVSPS